MRRQPHVPPSPLNTDMAYLLIISFIKINYDVMDLFSKPRVISSVVLNVEKALVTNCLSPKKTQTLKKLHIGTIITWYWYHIVIRITKQPYFGIKIFGQWYQYNLALVPNNTRVKFSRLKMTKLPLFESPKRLKRLVA